jgi:hypothetical protein
LVTILPDRPQIQPKTAAFDLTAKNAKITKNCTVLDRLCTLKRVLELAPETRPAATARQRGEDPKQIPMKELPKVGGCERSLTQRSQKTQQNEPGSITITTTKIG